MAEKVPLFMTMRSGFFLNEDGEPHAENRILEVGFEEPHHERMALEAGARLDLVECDGRAHVIFRPAPDPAHWAIIETLNPSQAREVASTLAFAHQTKHFSADNIIDFWFAVEQALTDEGYDHLPHKLAKSIADRGYFLARLKEER